mmetsp:Transcript_14183/g.34430  ORF Transcript_14183/g.34430 Transcript_14183/m.34430 type:complete len:311 (+) Transcript_14183:75-1007(+)
MKKQRNSPLFLLIVAMLTTSNGLTNGFKDPASSLATTRIHQVRGGSSVEEAAVEAGVDLLSKENLGAFFAVNGVLLGLGFQFATGLMMKIMHNFELGKPPANKAVYKAGASMLAYGTLAYGTVLAKLEPEKAMGYSLVPIVANLGLQDILEDDKSGTHKLEAGCLALIFVYCAYQLIKNGMDSFSVLFPVSALGLLSVLSILIPSKMMTLLEYSSEDAKGKGDEPEAYQMKFITQATGVHTLCYLAQFLAFYYGKDPFEAVGYAAGVTALLAIPVCIAGPNLRKSNAPLWPMYPFIVLFSYMAKKMVFDD